MNDDLEETAEGNDSNRQNGVSWLGIACWLIIVVWLVAWMVLLPERGLTKALDFTDPSPGDMVAFAAIVVLVLKGRFAQAYRKWRQTETPSLETFVTDVKKTKNSTLIVWSICALILLFSFYSEFGL